jgi:hypothetical protein
MEIAPRSGFVSDLFKGALTIGALVLVGLVVQHDSRMLVADEGPSGGEAARTRSYVTALASDRMAGRLTGTDGERLAGDYIISELKRIGAKPLPGRTDYRLPFEFTAGGRDGGSSIKIMQCTPGYTECAGGSEYKSTSEVQALSFSDDGDVVAPVVFAGYGIVVPESQGFGYDSYATLDVKDKVVLVLRYFPEDADQKTKGILSRYSDLRFKALQARQHGAKAMLVTTGPHSPNAGETIPMTFDTALSGSGIVAASVNAAAADWLFKNSGHTIEQTQHALDDANPHIAGFPLPVSVTLHTSVVREKRTGNDIVAYLPATTSTSGDPERVAPQPAQKPWVAFGAHYDHLGRGEAGNTLASKEESHQVHHGADDNASGDAAVLAAGATLAREARHRNVLLAFWSGEELGLIGSTAYVNSPPVPNDQIAAYFNFDMVGRMQDNKLTVQATGSSTAWPRILEQANITAGFDLILQEDPYQPTDVASFNQASVPCLAFFTGTHIDYHKPSDTADKINYEDLARVADFAVAIARRVDDAEEPPAFVKVEQKASSGPGVAGVRVFTGTIPDYSNDVKGLLLSGVIGGGPAEQAGLQKGDVVVEIAGQTITNIYDYTYALDVLKIGTPTKVVYMRGGQRKETMLTPAARK